MMFFTADNHFDHANSIRLCNRPYESVEHMNEDMIEKWNNKLTNNDDIIIAGDMFFRSQDPEAILRRLKGKKHLIIGNHDTWIKKVDVDKYFKEVSHYLVTNDGRHGLVICHYPQVSWPHAQRFYMVHGHIHADTRSDYWPLLVARDRVLNAGVDINGFEPVTFEEMLENNIRFKAAHPCAMPREEVYIDGKN